MRLRAFLLVVLAIAATLVGTSPADAATSTRSFTVVNQLTETVWIAAWQQTPKPALHTTGWTLKPGASVTITVPNKWNGRIWARTGCTFVHGKGHCVTGDCDGRFQCTGYGSLPATLAEFNLDSYKHLDFYDVSLVDGSNVPMWINHSSGTKDALTKYGCAASGCTKDVACPAKLRVPGGCLSPCAQLGTAKYCCAGKYAVGCSPAKTWPINYAKKVFKKAEPFAYSWSGDDATSTFTCTGGCDYRIVLGTTPAGHTKRPKA
jgi:Thaumatin family